MGIERDLSQCLRQRELKGGCLCLCVVQHRGLDTLLSEQDLDTISSSTNGWSGSEIEVLYMIPRVIRVQVNVEVDV